MIDILDNTKKKRIIERISYLGIEKIPYLLLKTGRETIRAYSGSLTKQDISFLAPLLTIEGIGLYFGKETDDGVRLSLDALQLLRGQITKNKVILTADQEERWFKGENIELSEEQTKEYQDMKAFVCVFSSDKNQDILGTGKISNNKKLVSNFLPKERRIRTT